MRAALIERFGGAEVLRVVQVPAPSPGPGQVLLDVAASSVNPVDIAVRSGWMAAFLPLTPPMTLGTDVAGVVADVGEGVTDFAVGDSVYGVGGVVMGGSGGFAEQVVTSAGLLAASPAIDVLAAGSLPLAGTSAIQAITEKLRVEPGSRVLVHGASGGVGLMAVALAKHQGGEVVATVHRGGSAALDGSGADDVVDTDDVDLSSLPPFDLTLDLVGTDPMLPVAVTRSGGRAVGLRAAPDPQAAAAKGIEAVLQATEITTDRLARLRDYVEQGVLTPCVARIFDLPDVARAISAKEAGGIPGKIAVRIR